MASGNSAATRPLRKAWLAGCPIGPVGRAGDNITQSRRDGDDIPMTDLVKHQRMANAIRALAMDAVQKAKSGHPGMPMGMADVATVLFTRYLKFDPTDPEWPDRDRFVLSAGHGSMLLYAVLYLLGVEDMTIDEIKRFRQLDSATPGHPEYGHAAGVETTTGPLGQGITNAVGMALAERIMAAQFGSDVVDHRTYVIASDGDLMEGISHEAISIAGHLRLNKLIVLFDDNGISIDGPLSLAESGDQVARFKAANWNAVRVDGQDPAEVAAAIEAAQASDKPSLIACKTTIGFGAPTKAGTADAHGSPLGDDEIAGARKALGWDSPPFEIPADIRDAWRIAGLKSSQTRKDWQKRLASLNSDRRGEFERRVRGDLPTGFAAAITEYKRTLAAEAPTVATRKASEMALEVINAAVPETVGGSADLTPSNNTHTKGLADIKPGDYSGRYIHWGVREHGMASAMNGIALHRGLIPYAGTFLIFSDYARPAIRLSALMKQRVVYVMTHDSIGLGEDGPTHEPVEQLAALARHPQPQGLPASGRHRDRRVLADGAGEPRRPEPSGAHPAEPAGAPQGIRRGQPVRARRLRGRLRRRRRRGVVVRLRLRGRDRARRLADDRACRPPRPRRLRPLLRAVRGRERRLPGRDHRQRAGQRRHRGGRALRLGPHHRPRRDFHRHAQLRRQRAL